MNIVTENWEEILLILKKEYEITDVSFNTWLKPLKVHSVEDHVVTIIVPSELSGLGLTYIRNRYKFPFQETIGNVVNMDDCEVQFVLQDEIAKEEPKPKAKPNYSEDPRFREAGLFPKYTFDTFIVGSNNKFAHAASLAVAESPGDTYNPLFIYGGAGLGKTHLMHSIAHFILEHNENMKVLYVPSEDFTNELINTIRNGNNTAMNKFREKYRNIDVLLVDDIQFIIGKESTQEEFFHTFNSLHNAKKQIIISSDKPPKEMEILDERFRSRFEWGLIADISAPDYETRMAILHNKEEMDGCEISEDVLQYIANNVKSNIRELEGAFNKVVAFARLENKEINLSFATEVLKDFITPDKSRKITLQDVTDVVADYYQISADDIKGEKRTSKIAFPRQVAMYLMREVLPSYSSKSVGEFLNRDHSTVLHGVEKIENEIQSDEGLQKTIELLKGKLKP